MKTMNLPAIIKSLIVLLVIAIGFFMPCLSRIPNSFAYGTSFIWSYTDPTGSFWWWNSLQLGSTLPIFLFGMIYIFGNARLAFYASALSHFGATWFFYHDHGVIPQRDDFLGFIVYPFLIGIPSLLCGIAGLIVELIVQNRTRRTLPNE